MRGLSGAPTARRDWLRRLKFLFLTLAALGIAGFSILEGIVLSGCRSELNQEPGAMVILGAQVKPWGPSVMLQDRLDTALAYWEEHPELPIVVSGGQGSDEPTTEAFCMYQYLVEHGVDGRQIWQEGNSHNTSQNLLMSKALLEDLGLDGVPLVVVSNGFHLARVRMLSERYSMEVSTLAAPSSDVPSRIKMYLREPLALVKSFLFD